MADAPHDRPLAVRRRPRSSPARTWRSGPASIPRCRARLWRALGFPDVPDGAPVFTQESIDVLRTLQERVDGVVHAAQRLAARPGRDARATGPRDQRWLRPGRRGAQRFDRRLGGGGARRRARRRDDRAGVHREPRLGLALAASSTTCCGCRCATRCGASSPSTTSSATRPHARRRLPRPRRLHRVEPGARGRRARRARLPVRGAHPRHDRGARRTAGEDDRRRGDVRLRGAGGHRADRAAAHRADRRRRGAARRARPGSRSGRSWPGRATTTGPSSTSRTGSSSSPTRAPCWPRTSCTTRSPTTRAFSWGRSRDRKIRDIGRVGTWPLASREGQGHAVALAPT